MSIKFYALVQFYIPLGKQSIEFCLIMYYSHLKHVYQK